MYTGGISSAVPTPSNTELPRIRTPRFGDTALSERADPVQRQAEHEAALPAPAVGQLAARDHQDRHDQEEQRDRGLHALDGRVQVVADVGDHHVHVRAREAADELRERERQDQPTRGRKWPIRRHHLAHRCRVFAHAAAFEPASATATAAPISLRTTSVALLLVPCGGGPDLDPIRHRGLPHGVTAEALCVRGVVVPDLATGSPRTRSRRRPRKVRDLTTGDFTHLDNVLVVRSGKIRLAREPEQLAFVSAKTTNTTVAP